MKFLNFPSTLTSSDLAQSEMCKRHITTGYRRPNRPWSYYILSVFQVNNQAINVWTHFIGFLFIAYRTYDLSLTFDLVNDATMRNLGAGLIGMLIVLAASSFAHMFSERSEEVHYCCFFIDYAGIGIYSMVCSMMSHTYLVRDRALALFLVKWSRPVNVFLAIQFTALLSFPKIWLRRENKLRRSLQGLVAYPFYLWLLLPLFYRYFWPSDHYFDETLALHRYHVILFHVNILVYCAHIPERFFPGTFDFIGQSHGVHHVMQVMTANNYIDVILQEIRLASPRYLKRYLIQKLGTVQNSYGVILAAIYLNFVIIAVAGLCAIRKVAQSKSITQDTNNVSTDLNDNAYCDNDDDDDDDDDSLLLNGKVDSTFDDDFDLLYDGKSDKTQ